MVRVLVVEDSTFMRMSIVDMLSKDPDIKVVDTARDGVEALEKASKQEVDVITLDVEMPRLNGLDTLKKLMETNPLPVIMVSSLTEEGAESTLKAMEFGAQDFIPKTLSNDKDSFGAELRKKVKAIARRKSIVRLKYHAKPQAAAKPQARASAKMAPGAAGKGPRDIVVIGVSTGGPPVVQKIISALPGNLPCCILIAQHMPAAFTGPFAKRLNGVSQFNVTEAQLGDKLINGHAYVCPGGKHIGIRHQNGVCDVLVTDRPKDALYKPTVNLLMETAGNYLGSRTLGVMLTGMGADGVEGAEVLRKKGGLLIAQSEASCVVYGMPKAVVDANLANLVLDADDIAQAIVATVRG